MGFGTGGAEGLAAGMKTDLVGQKMRQDREEKAAEKKALQALGMTLKAPPEVMGNETALKIWLSNEHQRRQDAQTAAQQSMANQHWNQNQAFEREKFDWQRNQKADPLTQLDPDKVPVIRDPSVPGGYRKLDIGAGLTGNNPYMTPGNVDQQKEGSYATRAAIGNDLLNKYEDAGLSRAEDIKSTTENGPLGAIPGVAGSMTSPQRKGFEQAEKAFINALLRRDSGAAISADEYKRYRAEFVPALGDDEQTLRQKGEARRQAVQSLMAGASRGYRPPKGWEDREKAGLRAPKGGGSGGTTSNGLNWSLE
jgi:hypothetical protein